MKLLICRLNIASKIIQSYLFKKRSTNNQLGSKITLHNSKILTLSEQNAFSNYSVDSGFTCLLGGSKSKQKKGSVGSSLHKGKGKKHLNFQQIVNRKHKQFMADASGHNKVHIIYNVMVKENTPLIMFHNQKRLEGDSLLWLTQVSISCIV